MSTELVIRCFHRLSTTRFIQSFTDSFISITENTPVHLCVCFWMFSHTLYYTKVMFTNLSARYILGSLYINHSKNDFVMFNHICCYDNHMTI